ISATRSSPSTRTAIGCGSSRPARPEVRPRERLQHRGTESTEATKEDSPRRTACGSRFFSVGSVLSVLLPSKIFASRGDLMGLLAVILSEAKDPLCGAVAREHPWRTAFRQVRLVRADGLRDPSVRSG